MALRQYKFRQPKFRRRATAGRLFAVPCRAVPCRVVPCRAVPCRVAQIGQGNLQGAMQVHAGEIQGKAETRVKQPPGVKLRFGFVFFCCVQRVSFIFRAGSLLGCHKSRHAFSDRSSRTRRFGLQPSRLELKSEGAYPCFSNVSVLLLVCHPSIAS